MSAPDFEPALVGPAIIIKPGSSDDWTQLFAKRRRHEAGGRALLA